MGSVSTAWSKTTGVFPFALSKAICVHGFQLVSRFFSRGQRRHLHERMLWMKQPKAFPPMVQVVDQRVGGQALPIPARAVAVCPGAEAARECAVRDGQKKPMQCHEIRRRGFDQSFDL